MFIDPIPDQASTYTGPTYPDLGVNYGDRLNTLLIKVLDILTNLSVPNLNIDTNTIPANSLLYGLGGKSVASAQITTRAFNISVDPTSGTKGQLSYDIAETKANLPAGYKAISVTVNVTDFLNKRTSSSGDSGTVSIVNFPAVASFTVGVRTPSGDVKLEKSVFIPSSVTDSKTLNLEIKDLSGPNEAQDLTLKETLDVLASKLSIVSQQVEDLRALNIAVELEKLKAQSSQV